MEAQVPYVTDGDGMHTFTDPADDATYVAAYAGMDLAQKVLRLLRPARPEGPDVGDRDRAARLDGDRQRPAGGARRRHLDLHHDAADLDLPLHGVRRALALAHLGARRPAVRLARPRVAGRRARPRLRRTCVRSPRRCFDFYTSTFDEPYPFDSYDQVMGPGHNWGAMETAGCVTFRDEYLPPQRAATPASWSTAPP